MRGDKPDATLLAELGPLPEHEGVVIVEPELFEEVREVLTLDQLGEFVAKHHTRDLFRLETLPFYRAASDDDDFGRYLRGESAPTAEAKQPWLDRIRSECIDRALAHRERDRQRSRAEQRHDPEGARAERAVKWAG